MSRILPFMWFVSGAAVATFFYIEKISDKVPFGLFVVVPAIIAALIMEYNRND